MEWSRVEWSGVGLDCFMVFGGCWWIFDGFWLLLNGFCGIVLISVSIFVDLCVDFCGFFVDSGGFVFLDFGV